MLNRMLILSCLAIALAASALLVSLNSVAHEASPGSEALGEPARSRITLGLTREGYTSLGEIQRKGDFLILTAIKDNRSWRLILDGRSGEIIGQRSAVAPANFTR